MSGTALKGTSSESASTRRPLARSTRVALQADWGPAIGHSVTSKATLNGEWGGGWVRGELQPRVHQARPQQAWPAQNADVVSQCPTGHCPVAAHQQHQPTAATVSR